MNALVLGASAGLGRALSESLAARGHSLLLVARDPRDLDAQAKYLRLKYGVRVEILPIDAGRPEDCVAGLRAAAETFGEITGLFFPLGASRGDDKGQLPLADGRRLMDVNLLTVMAVVGAFLPGLLAADRTHIVGFGSIAAVRGRRANIVYAAAKRGLASYFESLRHLTAGSKVRVQFYRLGYLATQQTFGRRLLFPPASPKAIAETVVRSLDKDHGGRYLPRYWAIGARLIGMLPWFVFKRLDY